MWRGGSCEHVGASHTGLPESSRARHASGPEHRASLGQSGPRTMERHDLLGQPPKSQIHGNRSHALVHLHKQPMVGVLMALNGAEIRKILQEMKDAPIGTIIVRAAGEGYSKGVTYYKATNKSWRREDTLTRDCYLKTKTVGTSLYLSELCWCML